MRNSLVSYGFIGSPGSYGRICAENYKRLCSSFAVITAFRSKSNGYLDFI